MKKMINKPIITAVLATFLLIGCNSYANATTLPEKTLDTIKKELPDASIRFDSLISLKDGTVYLPVIPSSPPKNYSGKITYTYPANKSLAQKPEVVMFDSNLALLKVLKTNDGNLTISNPANIPFVVKTGLFPQDMLVPPGLIIPEELKIMMGDLKIASSGSRVDDIFKKPTVQKGYITNSFVPVPQMKAKSLLYTAINSKLVTVASSDAVDPLYTLEMENLPKFIQPVCKDNFILVAAAGKTYIDVADVNNEVLVKKIDLSSQPTEIILNKNKDTAYVATSNEQALFVIDLKSMNLVEKIKVKGYPRHIAISQDDKEIVYQDKNSGDIYTLNMGENYVNKFVYNLSNISKLITKDGYLYILSRAESNLQIVDEKSRELIYKQKVSEKPVDMLLHNNDIFILSAKGDLGIFNLNEYSFDIVSKLTEYGFLRKIIKVQNSDIVLITNITEKKYYVYDLMKKKVLQTVNTPVYVNDLQIINKTL